MTALFALLSVALVVVTMLVAINRTAQEPKLTRPEKRELEKLRDMRDTLLNEALDSVEVEPFAVKVIDTIRQTQREINK